MSYKAPDGGGFSDFVDVYYIAGTSEEDSIKNFNQKKIEKFVRVDS